MESSNDVIIQNLVVPSSTMLTNGGNQADSINLNVQHQELALISTSTSGVITETRGHGSLNNDTCITSSQTPVKTTQVTQVFEESLTSIEQTNPKVKYVIKNIEGFCICYIIIYGVILLIYRLISIDFFRALMMKKIQLENLRIHILN